MADAQIKVTIDVALMLETLKYTRQKVVSMKTFRFGIRRVRQNAVTKLLDVLIEHFEQPNKLTVDGEE